MTTLSDVHRVVLAKSSIFCGPIEVSVVNFVAPNAFPRNFFYRGCTEHCEDDSICKVSIEGPRPKQCLHNASGSRNIAEFFRFEVVLMDESLMPLYGKPTIRACIWDAAWNLLHISAPTLAGMGALEQVLYVQDCFKHLPRCTVTIRVTNGAAHIQDLEIVNTTSILPKLSERSINSTSGRPCIGSEPRGTPAARTPPATRLSKPVVSSPMSPSVSSPLPHEYRTPASSGSQQSSDIDSGLDEEAEDDSGTITTVVRRLASAFSSSHELLQARAVFLSTGGHTREPPTTEAVVALPLPNKPTEAKVPLPLPKRPTLRPWKAGLSLKEPDSDLSDVSDFEPQPKRRARPMEKAPTGFK
ncbi:unnamed protein product [Calypogeia fissa]